MRIHIKLIYPTENIKEYIDTLNNKTYLVDVKIPKEVYDKLYEQGFNFKSWSQNNYDNRIEVY